MRTTLATVVLFTAAATLAAGGRYLHVTFELFRYGSPDGQRGWESTGSTLDAERPLDHAVVPNVFGYDAFGRRVLRISNAVANTSFADQTLSAAVPEAGEPVDDRGSRRPRRARGPRVFRASWAFAPAVWAHQPGLSVVVSPVAAATDRMSWIELADTVDGLSIRFFDYQDAAPFGSLARPEAGAGPEDGFVNTEIAGGLDRNRPHTVAIEVAFEDGPRNDQVRVWVDGRLRHTGTSWEDYYRWQAPDGRVGRSRPVSRLLFRTGGDPAPGSFGLGLVFDRVTLATDDDRANGLRTDRRHGRPRWRQRDRPRD